MCKVKSYFRTIQILNEKIMNILKIYKQLPRSDKAIFREAIMQACGWAYGTFYYKMNHGNISKLERKVVSEYVEAFLSKA